MKPFYITIEGLDFCGKTTLIQKIEKYLTSDGFQVYRAVMAKEGPLREAALHTEGITPVARMMLMRIMADQVYADIRKAHLNGYVVLSDRGVDSYIAYQGYGDGLLTEAVKIDKFFHDAVVPDLTFYLDLPKDERMKRGLASGRTPDQIESKSSEYFDRVEKGYKTLIEADQADDPPRIHVLDASQSPQQVFMDAMSILDFFLESRDAEEEAEKRLASQEKSLIIENQVA